MVGKVEILKMLFRNYYVGFNVFFVFCYNDYFYKNSLFKSDNFFFKYFFRWVMVLIKVIRWKWKFYFNE